VERKKETKKGFSKNVNVSLNGKRKPNIPTKSKNLKPYQNRNCHQKGNQK
jgi:hypothetical protein